MFRRQNQTRNFSIRSGGAHRMPPQFSRRSHLVTTGQVILAGEVTTTAWVDHAQIARDTIKEIGYIHPEIGFDCFSCGVLSAIHSQSPDIARGVDRAEDNNKEQ